MPKFQFKDLTSRTAAFFKQKVLPRLSRLPDYLVLFVSSWWHVILIAFAALVFLYYPIGGLMVSSIDTNTSYEIKEPETNQSATVDMWHSSLTAKLTKKCGRRTCRSSFRLIFSTTCRRSSSACLTRWPSSPRALPSALAILSWLKICRTTCRKPAVLLKYPGTVWMFSPTNRCCRHIRPIPNTARHANT